MMSKKVSVQGMKDMILKAVKEDPIIRANLQSRPQQTIREILGVDLPEVLEFHVVVENPRKFGLVIPEEE
jgi:hypothetical protein